MHLRDGGSAHADGPRPSLVVLRDPGRGHGGADPPQAAVLLLHGGRADGLEPPSVWNLPGVRMRPFARAVARTTAGRGVLLARVRYRHRGWNGDRGDTTVDARRALEELTERVGPVPVVLVGHSMGARAALRVAGHPQVRAVVGLASWCPPGEPVEQLRGRRVVLLHGDRDRRTDPRTSRELAQRGRDAGARTAWVTVPGGGHMMLRHAAAWHSLTARAVAGLLELGPLPREVADGLSGSASQAREE